MLHIPKKVFYPHMHHQRKTAYMALKFMVVTSDDGSELSFTRFTVHTISLSTSYLFSHFKYTLQME